MKNVITMFPNHLPCILHDVLLGDASLWPEVPTKSQMEYPQLGFRWRSQIKLISSGLRIVCAIEGLSIGQIRGTIGFNWFKT
jgi:hypothetical protein